MNSSGPEYRAYRANRALGTADWPGRLDPAALHGLAGDFVRLVGPHTEADPAGLLLQFHVATGNLIGRGPHFMAEADRHYTNLFAVLVGETAKGRKGTSLGHVQSRLSPIDPSWSERCIVSGLSSGEGLIHAVRDPASSDGGSKEKRLLVVESEFASTLRVLRRDGNTLSPIIRQAWDSKELRTLTKNSPLHAKDAHISIIGHVTKEELRRYLTQTEVGNGFANRFLWVCVRRSNLLPEGGRIDEVDFRKFDQALKAAVSEARSIGELRRDEGARSRWHEVYGELSEGQLGLFGAVTSRGEAQVMRLATVYALLDRSPVISLPHLEAALAVWAYCEVSALHIFGGDLGDPIADEIWAVLLAAPGGKRRDDLRNHFNRHVASREIGRALRTLQDLGMARVVQEPTGGRPAERWFAIPPDGAESAECAQTPGTNRAYSASGNSELSAITKESN